MLNKLNVETKLMNVGYSLDDVSIVPAIESEIEHRSEVNPYVTTCGRITFPIFVAPMESVVDENNYKKFLDEKVIPVIPRSVQKRLSLDERLEIAKETFVSFSLAETELLYRESYLKSDVPLYICVDLAQGGMTKLIDLCSYIKEDYGDMAIIMTGNIANPLTYEQYCMAGIDYVRCSIGSGSRCTTSCATGIHYPTATLLNDIAKIKCSREADDLFTTKVIMDGGINWYDKIQKSIVLGADYVMIGKMFAETFEACGEIKYAASENDFIKGRTIAYTTTNSMITYKPYRMYRGMSHRSSQKLTGGDGSKVSEGICAPVEVKYNLHDLMGNIEAYLRSCMSYTNSKTIEDLKNAEIVILGGSSANTFKK